MFKNIINKGITPDLSFTEQKKIRLLNSIAFVGILIISTFLFFAVFTPADKESQLIDIMVQLINLTAFGTMYLLSINRKHFASRVLLIIWFPLFLSALAISIGISYTASYLTIIPVSLMVLFLFDKKSQIFIFFLYCVLIFMFIVINERVGFVPKIVIQELQPYNNYFLIEIIMAFFINYIVANNFKSEHLNFEKKLIENSKEIELKQKDITDSINYAKRIQYAVLPHEETIYRSIPLSFIFYKPKDIVSGDFFWFHELNRDEYILVCADCTGHGVPGAFMTVIGSSLLNQTVIDNKITKPSEILNELDKQINFTLKQQKDTDSSVQDGMDLSLIKVNKAKNQIILTSAKRPVVFVKNNELKEIRGNKFSMGGMRTGDKVFEEIELNYSEGDVLYLYTDGYADQFGGEKGKKYSSKRLRELFSETYKLNMNEQKQKIEKSIDSWKGSHEQVDDILVIGIKF